MSELVTFNARAVQDEANPAGYCLNCIKKHSAMAHGLFVEMEQRVMQGSPLTDTKIREKMSQAFEQMVHIEDHAIVKMPVDGETHQILSGISSQANSIRAKLKEGEWALDVEGHIPKGSINDITEMRLMTKKLQKFNDRAIVDFGCGDCAIDNLRKTNSQISVTRRALPEDFSTITGNNLNNSDEDNDNNNIENTSNGESMSQGITQKIGSTFGQGDEFLSKATGMAASIIDLDRATLTEILNPQILASLSEKYIWNMLLNPGFRLLGNLLVGLGFMTVGPKIFASSERGKVQLVHYGAALAAAILRSSPGEVSAMINELGSLGRLALASPRVAMLAPFRNIAQIRSDFRNSAPRIPGLGVGVARSLQSTLQPLTDEVRVDLPGKAARFRIA